MGDDNGCCGCLGRKKKKVLRERSPQTVIEEQKLLKSGSSSPLEKSARSQRDEKSAKAKEFDDESSRSVSIGHPDRAMQLAAGKLAGLTAQEQEQVAIALTEEMERQRKWKRLLRTKGMTKKKEGKKTVAKTPSIEDILGGGLFDEVPAGKKGHAGPKMVQKKGGVAGDQPESLSIDAEQAKELGRHKLMGMMEMALESERQTDAAEKKQPSEMTVEELIAFRRRNPKAWDKFTSSQSVAAFALSKATPQDKEKAQKALQKKGKGPKLKRLLFDDTITVASVPAGQDFRNDEQLDIGSGRINYDPDPLKK